MAAGALRAGVKQVAINPPLPCQMSGYFHERLATAVALPLHACALALIREGGPTVVLLACDLITMTDELCLPALTAASQRYGIPLSHFIATGSHTHTGPEIRRSSHVPVVEDYLKIAPALLTEAVMGALAETFDAVLAVGQTRAPGLAHNRLSRCADGSEVFGRESNGQRIIGAAGPEDDTVQTLSVYDSEKRLRAVAVNFACHPDLAGGGRATAISADWPGEMADYLRRVHGPELVTLFLQGTAGDINHQHPRASERRWLPDGRSAVARGVAGAALYAMESASVMPPPLLAGVQRELTVPYYTRDATLWELVARLKAKGEAATYFEKNLIKKVENWPNDGQVDHLRVTCLRVGDLAIVGLPGEIFTAWGLEIKRYSPARQTLIVELCTSHDGLTGYKPSSDQALRGARGHGAYGALPTMSQRHWPAAGQMLTETAIALLYELWA